MKINFRVLFLFLFFCFTHAKSQNYKWDISLGGAAYDGGANIMRDSKGNIYSLGGIGGSNYIVKLDTNGNFIWTKALGTGGGNQMAIDKMDNLYITGNFIGAVDFDPGPNTVILPYANYLGWIMFVIKINESGNFVWGKSMGGDMSSGLATDIAVDSLCNVYYTGMHKTYSSNPNLYNWLDFDPGPSSYFLPVNPTETPFVSSLDSAGNFRWAKSLDGIQQNYGGYGNAICTDASNNVYTTGDFKGTIDFDPNNGTNTLTSSGGQIFISKLDYTGNFIWVKNLGGPVDNIPRDIVTDQSGNIYTTGDFSGTADFDPGVGTSTSISQGENDVFISKLDPGGNYLWSKSFGGPGPDNGIAITCDRTGNVYTTGGYSLTVDFDPGPGTTNFVCSGWWDMFITKLDTSGNFLWAKTMNGKDSTSLSAGMAIVVDQAENLYTTGIYQGSVDFNPDYGTSIKTDKGNRDSFISKLGKCAISLNTVPGVTLCAGKNTTLSASGAAVYSWTPGGSTTSNIVVTSSVSTVYTVTGALANDCQISEKINVSVVSNPVTGVSITNSKCPDDCSGSINAATMSGLAPFTYSISNGGLISIPYSALCIGLYNLYTTDANGCTANNIFSIDCMNTLGFANSNNLEDVLKIYPNPATEKVTLDLNGKKFGYRLYNVNGQLIATNLCVTNNISIDLTGFFKGIYFIEVSLENEIVREKLVVE
jgi:hypothetical protein